MDLATIIQNAFYAMATVLGTLGLSTMRKLNDSVNELNVKIAVVMARLEHLENESPFLNRKKGK